MRFYYFILKRGLRAKIKTLDSQTVRLHFNKYQSRYAFGVFGSSIAFGTFCLMHYKNTPITNRKRFIMFTPNQLAQVEELQKKSVSL